MTRLNIEISEEKRKLIKICSAIENKHMKDFILEAIDAKLSKFDKAKEPNKLTKLVLEQSRQGINVKSFSSIEDLKIDLSLDD